MGVPIVPIRAANGFSFKTVKCWSCREVTPVAAVLLSIHESRWDEEDEWQDAEGTTVLSYITVLNSEALTSLKAKAPWMQLMPSKRAQETYWANGCTGCGVLQGDWHLHSEPGGPFFPETEDQEAALTLEWYAVPIEAQANGGESSWMDRLVERVALKS